MFWDFDPLSMVTEPIAYFGEYGWDMDSRFNLDLAGATYTQVLGELGIEKQQFREAPSRRIDTAAHS